MISRSTLIGALVVVELGLLGLMGKSLAGSGRSYAPTGSHWFAHAPPHRVASFDASLAAGAEPHVLIDAPRYRITVTTVPGETVRISGGSTISGSVRGMPAPVTIERTGDGVRIHADDRPVHALMMGHILRELHVTLPAASTVEAIGAGRLTVIGLQGKLLARLDNAPVVVRDQRGEVDLSSANGRIELNGITADRVSASSSNGRIFLDRVDTPLLNVHTANGRIEGSGLRVADGRINSGNGRIAVGFDAESDATITASSGNGRVTSTEPSSSPDGGRTQVIRFGSGRGQFSVSSGNGPIAITHGAHA